MRQVIEVPWPLEKKDAKQVASLYATVFAGEPWKEVSRCSRCGAFSAGDPTESTPCTQSDCGGYFSEPAYPEAETTASIQSELAKPMAKGLMQVKVEAVRLTIEEILAFGWGYATQGSELAQGKYQKEEMRSIISELLVRAGVFFYISEVGVKPTQQSKGIGKKITDILASSGKQQLGTVVLRTNENSPMRYIAQNLGMKPIIGLDTGIPDTENPMRVIFVGGKYERK